MSLCEGHLLRKAVRNVALILVRVGARKKATLQGSL